MTPNVAAIIRQHVSLEVRCIDRLYLHAWMPKLQTSGGLCYFLQTHLGHPIPSPALFKPLHDRFVSAVPAFAQRYRIPLIAFEPKQRKDDIVADYRQRFTGREGVVVIGVAQEKMRSFKAHKRAGPGSKVTFDFSRQSVSVNHSYFYVLDCEWGPALLKIGTYVPYPVKLCLNGHDWVKQHLRRQRVRFEPLDNGCLRCADAAALQATCDALGPADVQAFFDRWSHRQGGTSDRSPTGWHGRRAEPQDENAPEEHRHTADLEPERAEHRFRIRGRQGSEQRTQEDRQCDPPESFEQAEADDDPGAN
jgi:hypothetical protein